jgi:hypothetical protein
MFVEALKLEMPDTVTNFMSHKAGEEDLKGKLIGFWLNFSPLLIHYIRNRKERVHLNSLIIIQCCVWVFGFAFYYSMLYVGIWFHLLLFKCCMWVFDFVT